MSDLIEEVRVSRSLPPPALAREVRRAAGVSRPRMAEALGVHPVSVARWERGSRAPRGARRLKYAALLAELARASQ
jgi:DNA-binding transcriptional regulator YiaG